MLQDAKNMEQEIKRNLPRDVFLHLLAIVTLYWSSITFVTLLWQFINYFLPDLLNYYVASYSVELIRFAVSSLFIVFPLFIYISWFLNKIYAKEIVVRESKIRKWLLYFTLFLAALISVGDIVSVIYNLLGGETTLRFILKALSVLLVTGFIFTYYLDDLRREAPSKLGKIFAWIAGTVILVAVVSSFFIIGSPNTARMVQLDQQKVSDLQGVQSEIINYWQRKEKLPSSLTDLNDSISGYQVARDPQTKQSYEYIVNDESKLSFSLCAVFNKDSNSAQKVTTPNYYPEQYAQNWNHSAGRYCFERTIDKQLYPPIKNIKQ